MIVFDGINLAKTRQQNAVMTSNIFAAYSIVMAFSSNAQLYHMPLSICKQLYALNWSTSWFSFILFNVSLHWKLEINTFRLWLVLDQNLIHRNCLTFSQWHLVTKYWFSFVQQLYYSGTFEDRCVPSLPQGRQSTTQQLMSWELIIHCIFRSECSRLSARTCTTTKCSTVDIAQGSKPKHTGNWLNV